MTHAGPGIFGAATGKPIFARTIADCVCINNRIVHEWLVRDQAAIARQTGRHERDLAQTWLDERGGFHKAAMPAPPAPYRSFVDPHPLAAAYADVMQRLWATGETTAINVWHDPACIVAIPGGDMCVGQAALRTFWAGLLGSLQQTELSIEHLVANERVERATTVAMRWRVRAQHGGTGRYGAPVASPLSCWPSRMPILIMAASCASGCSSTMWRCGCRSSPHAEIQSWRVYSSSTSPSAGAAQWV